MDINEVNQVWAVNITFIPMRKEVMYLTAIIDLYSRYVVVVNWSVFNSMDAKWCLQIIQEAILIHGKPEIINTDQRSQFSLTVFTDFILKDMMEKLSMEEERMIPEDECLVGGIQVR